MNPRLLAAICIAGLLGAFAIDLATPQLFIVAILLDVPIVLSAFAGNRRLTGSLVAAALMANAIAGYFNGLWVGSHWDAIAIANRLLAALSIILVGWLGLALHRRAEQRGIETAIADAVRRERALREASESIRGSLSEELVERTIVREALRLADAARASFYRVASSAGPWTRFDAVRGSAEVVEVVDRPKPGVQSIITGAMERRETSKLSRNHAIGRLVLDTLGAESAIAAPLVDAGTTFGTLLVLFDRDATDEDVHVLISFAEAAGIALGQARLFVELAHKNIELAERSQVIRDIVYALSHDLRTPLAAAGLTLRQARDSAYGPMPARYGEILERSIAANDELQRLAETLLLVAQYESGERATIHLSLNLAALVNEVVTQLRPLADSKHLQIDVHTLDATVLGDQSELRRALVNLFANAVTWSRDGDRIDVGMQIEGSNVRVSIADQGFGVPEDLRQNLFMRFAGDHVRGAGTGLGLYIVRRITESHGGSARYEPNKPRGSIFSIELPFAVTPVATTVPA